MMFLVVKYVVFEALSVILVVFYHQFTRFCFRFLVLSFGSGGSSLCSPLWLSYTYPRSTMSPSKALPSFRLFIYPGSITFLLSAMGILLVTKRGLITLGSQLRVHHCSTPIVRDQISHLSVAAQTTHGLPSDSRVSTT